MILGWITFGSGGQAAQAGGGGTGPYWAYPTRGRAMRSFPPRARGNDVWVQTGDTQADDPASDTWEGEAT